MNLPSFDQILASALDEREAARLLRKRRIVEPIDAVRIAVGGVEYVNFSSNNYLGLTHHLRVIEAVRGSLAGGVGSGAAGLITGYTPRHASAERAIADWKGTESAVILPSGYQANLAAVQTLAAMSDRCSGGVRFLLDKRVHASLVDAVRATGVPMRVFPHNHVDKLRRLLAGASPGGLQVVVTESIFSMDGDAADLRSLAHLKAEHPFVLLLDEAHGSGVYGPAGRGYAAEVGLQEIVDVTVITFSKALGCVGGAVCASKNFRDALLNFGRAYIYSTSVPPFVPAAVTAAIEVMRDEPERQSRVRALARHVRSSLARWRADDEPSPFPAPLDSPIIPIIFADENRTLRASELLRARQFWVTAVRPPTVPRGSSRLRLTLSSAHTDEQVQGLIEAVRDLK